MDNHHIAQTDKLVIVTGPSGVGKGTVCRSLVKTMPALEFCVSATTRAIRPGETEGSDYYFLTPEMFQEHISNQNFLEWAQYATSFYGTLQSELARINALSKTPLLEIDTQGALQVRKKVPHALLLFITPPTFETLKERLTNRGTNTVDDIERRLLIAKEELAKIDAFDVVIENSDIDKTVEMVCKAIKSYLC